MLEIRELHTYFYLRSGVVKAVNGANLELRRGEIHGIVGESGSGKSVTGLSIMRLLPRSGRIISGSIIHDGKDLIKLTDKEMRKSVRGKKISMIFQDSLSSLNPTFKIGSQLHDSIKNFDKNLGRSKIKSNAIELLASLGVSDPEIRLDQYPFEVSGGIRQRVTIALAFAGQPDVLIADEPTTNLDVTIQAQIIELLKDIRNRLHTSIILITHNFGVVGWVCDKVSVMYSGRIVESASKEQFFKNPLHPYSKLLLQAMPRFECRGTELVSIPGEVPNLARLPTGCHFHPRCPEMHEICRNREPSIVERELGHKVECLIYESNDW